MGFVAPALSDEAVVEDRPPFFVVLDFEKNEESDAEGRTTVSDIIMDWVEGVGFGSRAQTPVMHRPASHGISGPFFLTHPSLDFHPVSRSLSKMAHGDGAAVELKKKKKAKKEKGEYMRRISCSGRSALKHENFLRQWNPRPITRRRVRKSTLLL